MYAVAGGLALELRGLTKSFGRKIVEDLDLSIYPGEFYALLGPNGAGKTTTLRMIAGLMRPDAGRINVFGHDVLADPL
ncbi:MAG: ATP-binding cassette domain-containing protein, partial [Acidocella sp.]|nr:ATP-binding cassette domain-containing protein [Acidocella sp.]